MKRTTLALGICLIAGMGVFLSSAQNSGKSINLLKDNIEVNSVPAGRYLVECEGSGSCTISSGGGSLSLPGSPVIYFP